MKPAAQIQASIELVDDVMESAFPADRIMANYFRARRYIGSKDKAAISEYLYTVLRNRLAYEYLLKEQELPVNGRFLLAAMLRANSTDLALGKSDLQEFYNGEGYGPKPFSSPALESLNKIDTTDLEQAPLNVQLNVPEWLAPKLQSALGERYASEMRASNQRASTDIRVNLLKSDVDAVFNALRSKGFEVEKAALSPWAIRFNSRVALFNLESFKQGRFEIQDQGSQILALLSKVKAGDKVVDFCAGAGGKTLALAAMMQNKGTLYACDVHTKRLEQLAKRSKRAGAHNIRVHTLSSENDKWVKKHRSMADVVLIDAPCSGTGTWRRSPDSRWNLQPENLQNLVALQQSILQSASRLVKPGGRLLYATCSLLNEENEQQLSTFMANNDDFELAEIALPDSLAANPSAIVHKGHELRLFPGLSDTDGFYVASLKRKQSLAIK